MSSSPQKKKDLTAAEGHIVLLEYLEEQPLLLARPGIWTHIAWLPCHYLEWSVYVILVCHHASD